MEYETSCRQDMSSSNAAGKPYIDMFTSKPHWLTRVNRWSARARLAAENKKRNDFLGRIIARRK